MKHLLIFIMLPFLTSCTFICTKIRGNQDDEKVRDKYIEKRFPKSENIEYSDFLKVNVHPND